MEKKITYSFKLLLYKQKRFYTEKLGNSKNLDSKSNVDYLFCRTVLSKFIHQIVVEVNKSSISLHTLLTSAPNGPEVHL